MKFRAVMLDDEVAGEEKGCDCLPDCEGISYEAQVDSRAMNAGLDSGGEEDGGNMAMQSDPFAVVQQVNNEC